MLLLVCFLAFDLPSKAFLLLIPVGIIVFTFSLIIGHFLSEPLRLLAKKTAAYRAGADVPFEPDGRLFEADELSTDFKAMTQTMKSQQHDLVLKERRQAAFISDVAHELRTPLTAIRGNAEMLEDPDLPPELHEKFCSIIINESERLSRLTHDLLTLQRIADDTMPMELSRVNLRELATGVLDALEPILRDRHANTEIIGEAPDVLGDPDRLKQAVTNLVENEPFHRARRSHHHRAVRPQGQFHPGREGRRHGLRRHRPAAAVRPLLPHRRLAQPRHGRHGPRPGHREVGGGSA